MDNKSCFVIMPFSATTDKHTEKYWDKFFEVINKEMELQGYVCRRSEIGPYNLLKHIIGSIYESDFVIAVLTDKNPSVWYELGVRHSLQNGTLMLIEDGQSIPFDISSYGVVKYSDDINLSITLEKEIRLYLEKLAENKHFDSPVLDFLNLPARKQDKIDELYELVLKLASHRSEKDFDKLPKTKNRYNKVLWVDDYPSNNELIVSMFKDRNVRFDIAINTEQGIDLLSKNDYDLVITDMGRGSESDAGLIFIKRTKELHIGDIPPIAVFASKQAIKNYGKQALGLGAIAATNDIAEVISLILRVLGSI